MSARRAFAAGCAAGALLAAAWLGGLAAMDRHAVTTGRAVGR
jgi:hypothetical protein